MAPCDICVDNTKCGCTLKIEHHQIQGSGGNCQNESVSFTVHGVNLVALDAFNISLPDSAPSFNSSARLEIVIPNMAERMEKAWKKLGDNFTAPIQDFVQQLEEIGAYDEPVWLVG